MNRIDVTGKKVLVVGLNPIFFGLLRDSLNSNAGILSVSLVKDANSAKGAVSRERFDFIAITLPALAYELEVEDPVKYFAGMIPELDAQTYVIPYECLGKDNETGVRVFGKLAVDIDYLSERILSKLNLNDIQPTKGK